MFCIKKLNNGALLLISFWSKPKVVKQKKSEKLRTKRVLARTGLVCVQLITGMIFEGPQLISEINRGLVQLLKKDGF